MKKLWIVWILCLSGAVKGNTSRLRLLNRLGIVEFFRHARRCAASNTPGKVASTNKLPVYTPEKVTTPQFLPLQPSPRSAVVLNYLELMTAQLTAPVKKLFSPHSRRDPRIEQDLAQIRDILAAAESTDQNVRSALRPPISRAA